MIAKILSFTSLSPYIFYLYCDIGKLAQDVKKAREEILNDLFDGKFYISLGKDDKILVSFKAHIFLLNILFNFYLLKFEGSKIFNKMCIGTTEFQSNEKYRIKS